MHAPGRMSSTENANTRHGWRGAEPARSRGVRRARARARQVGQPVGSARLTSRVQARLALYGHPPQKECGFGRLSQNPPGPLRRPNPRARCARGISLRTTDSDTPQGDPAAPPPFRRGTAL